MLYLISKNMNVSMIEKGSRKDDPNSGYFTLPGGKLKDGEKGLVIVGRLKSVIRETEEEIGIKPISPILLGVILFDNKERIFDNWKNPDDFLVYIFSAEKYACEIKKSNEGVPRTVPLNKVGEVPSNPEDKKMYRRLRDGRNFFGVIKHKGKELDEGGTWG